jgi:hypothetical protein
MLRTLMWRMTSRLNCSPAFGVAGAIAALVITCYIYRHVIIETAIVAGLVIIASGAIAACTAILLSTRNWYKSQPQAYAEYSVPEIAHENGPVTRTDMQAIAGDAEWLSGDTVELAFTEDGRLVAKDPQNG